MCSSDLIAFCHYPAPHRDGRHRQIALAAHSDNTRIPPPMGRLRTAYFHHPWTKETQTVPRSSCPQSPTPSISISPCRTAPSCAVSSKSRISWQLHRCFGRPNDTDHHKAHPITSGSTMHPSSVKITDPTSDLTVTVNRDRHRNH